MTIDLLIPIIRQLAHILGGILIARGVFDDGTSEAFVGLVVNLSTLIWWLVDRYRINRANRVIAKIAYDATDQAGA